MELWEHQKRVVGETYAHIRQGQKRILVASSTGSGKTVIFTRIIADAVSRDRRCLVIVDDSPLIPQTLDKLEKLGIEAGVIKAGHKPQYHKPVQVASVDTLIRRELPQADVVILDEAHLSFAEKYTKLIDRTHGFYKDAILLGFSATPERTNKRESLIRDWDVLVKGLTIQEAIASGVNCPFVLYSIKPGKLDLRKVRTSRGDFVITELSAEMRNPQIITAAVDEWESKAKHLTTIGFGADIAHIDALAAEFNRRGYKAMTIKGTDNENDRKSKFAALRNKEIDLLFSVNVLTLGFDEPSVECVLCCRPTKSMIVWIQQVGRGLRKHPGKTQAVILDQAENTRRLNMHPLNYEPQDLHSPRQSKGEAPTKTCPDCGAEVLTFNMVCPHCGYEFPPGKPPKDSLNEMVEVAARITNPALLKQKRTYASLLRQAMRRKSKPEWASMVFRERFGMYPSNIHRLHALYGEAYTEDNLKEYTDYLGAIAKSKGKDQEWITKHLRLEFGKS